LLRKAPFLCLLSPSLRPSALSAPLCERFWVHRALPGKATLVFAKSRLRNLAKHRKQIVTQAPRHGPYLRSTCARAAAQEHQAKGTLLAIGVAIPFIPLIPVSYCFINRDAGDEGDGPLQVGESCLDLSSLWRAPRQSAKNPFFCPDLRRCHILVPLSGGNEAQSGRDGQASKPLRGCRQDAAKRLPHPVQGPNPLARSTRLVFVLSPFSVLTLCFSYPPYLPRFALGGPSFDRGAPYPWQFPPFHWTTAQNPGQYGALASPG